MQDKKDIMTIKIFNIKWKKIDEYVKFSTCKLADGQLIPKEQYDNFLAGLIQLISGLED